VSEDLLTASDDALARAEALMTIVGGKVVYEK
jgi:predicted amidohydrolase YtcJ